nr:cation transporter [Pseudomonadota bacterium]
MHDGHSHSHDHSTSSTKVLIIAMLLTFVFAAIEAVSGMWANSLTLLSDAGHMAADGLAFGLGAFAAWVATKPPSDQH